MTHINNTDKGALKKDKLNQEIYVGDKVVFAPAGAYAGVQVGIIEKFTPKKVCIVPTNTIKGRHITSEKYYAGAKEIIKL